MLEGALPRGWDWWQPCDMEAHGCVLKALQRLLRWKGCYKINRIILDSEGWIQKRRWRHCLSGEEKSLLDYSLLKEQGTGSACERRA